MLSSITFIKFSAATGKLQGTDKDRKTLVVVVLVIASVTTFVLDCIDGGGDRGGTMGGDADGPMDGAFRTRFLWLWRENDALMVAICVCSEHYQETAYDLGGNSVIIGNRKAVVQAVSFVRCLSDHQREPSSFSLRCELCITVP